MRKLPEVCLAAAVPLLLVGLLWVPFFHQLRPAVEERAATRLALFMLSEHAHATLVRGGLLPIVAVR